MAGGTTWVQFRRRLQFSLGSLLLFTLFAGAMVAVYMRRSPWVVEGPCTKHREGSREEDTPSPSPLPRAGEVPLGLVPQKEKLVFVAQDRNQFVTGDEDGNFHLRYVSEPPAGRLQLMEDSKWQYRSENGRTFLLKLSDGNSELYETETQRFLATIEGSYPNFSNSCEKVVSMTDTGKLTVVDATTGQKATYFPFGKIDMTEEIDRYMDQALNQYYSPMIIIPRLVDVSDRYALAVFRAKPVVIDMKSGESIVTLPAVSSYNEIGRAKFSKDGSRMLVTGLRTSCWDLEAKEQLFDADMNSAYGTEFFPDGERVLVTPGYDPSSFGGPLICRDYTIVDAASGSALFEFPECFLDVESDDRIVRHPGILAEKNEMSTVWIRRHPEWWWGHFYRPEVWIAMLFGCWWLWRVIRSFRRA